MQRKTQSTDCALFCVVQSRRRSVRKEKTVNIRKKVDYSEMYVALDNAVAGAYSQMQMYAQIGKAVSSREEKGAAVAAAEYLQEQYPNIPGFSPRNLRRMREFYRVYSQNAEAFNLAMQIGWTQNVVILEAELTMQEHVWYLEQVVALNWSKKVLTENIQNAIHQKVHLDDLDDPCYTVQNDMTLENPVDEDTVSQPVGATPDPDRESDGESIIAGIYLRFENRPSIAECRLRQLRHPDWDGTNRPSGYVLHLWRRFFREDIPPDRVHRPPRNQGRMTV